MATDRYMKPGRFGWEFDARTTNAMKIGKAFKKAVESGEFGGTEQEYRKIQKNLSRFGRGTLSLDNPLLSRESANKAIDSAMENYTTPALKKARVKPIRSSI
jgi:hypothetical protein